MRLPFLDLRKSGVVVGYFVCGYEACLPRFAEKWCGYGVVGERLSIWFLILLKSCLVMEC